MDGTACHGGVVVTSLVRWSGLPLDDLAGRAWVRPTNASVTEWHVTPNPFPPATPSIELARCNDHDHLGGHPDLLG